MLDTPEQFKDNFEEEIIEDAKVIEEKPPAEEIVIEEENLQKLSFPLDPETIFALTNGDFILVGKATLISGVVAISDRRVKPSSIAIVSHETIAGTLGVTLVATCTDGTLTITSKDSAGATETSETSVVSYLVILSAKSTT